MGFFNDIIADARPAPKSLGESPNTALQNSQRLFGEELRLDLPGPLPGLADHGGDSSASFEVQGEVSSRIVASARGISVESQQINGDVENGGSIRERMSDPSSISLQGDGSSSRLPDRDAVASTVDPETGSVSKRSMIEGQTSDPLPESGPVENRAEAKAEGRVGKKPQPELVEQANDRQPSWEVRTAESAASPGLRENQVAPVGDPAEPRKVEVEPTPQELSREQRAVEVESPFEEKTGRDVSRTAMTQSPVAEDSSPSSPTPSTGEEQTQNQDAPISAPAFWEMAPASSPAERNASEPRGQEPSIQPQVSIGRIEVIVEVSDPPAAEKAVKSGAPSQDLSSRYYLRRL
jgi:hypothetical protein